MKKLLLTTVTAMVMGGAAYAAEPLAPFAPPPPPPPIVEPFFIPTWAGPYVGADIGWGWANIKRPRHHDFFFDGKDDFFFPHHRSRWDDDLDGVVGGVFAGWLGQRGNFLYGVELFAQYADIDNGKRDHRWWFDGGFFDGKGGLRGDPRRGRFVGGACEADFGDGFVVVPCPFDDVKVHALFGLEGMIGWGGDRAAFLLHAGPALGMFQHNNHAAGFFGIRTDRRNETEFGLSVAAEGRFKLTERVFAGVIGRAFWFPDVEVHRRHDVLVTDGVFFDDRRFRAKEDVTVFEVKARLGVMFGQPPAPAPLGPVEAAF
jgi:opacity protein-like surface antigen